MSNTKLQEDLKYGLNLEKEKEEQLIKKFGNLKKATNKFARLDWEGVDCFIELKSRRIKKDSFKDTLIGYNKVVAAEKCEKDCFFVFNFTDGLYYIKYEKDIGYKKKFLWGKNEGGKGIPKDYYYIPVNKLLPIN